MRQPTVAIAAQQADSLPFVQGFLALRHQYGDPVQAAQAMAGAMATLQGSKLTLKPEAFSDLIGLFTAALQVFWEVENAEALHLYGEMWAEATGKA